MSLPFNHKGDLALHVRYTGTDDDRPHGVRVSVNWANESFTTDSMRNSVNDLRLTHRVSMEGNLMLEVVVSNDVSSLRIPLHVGEAFFCTARQLVLPTPTTIVTMIYSFSLTTSSPSSWLS